MTTTRFRRRGMGRWAVLAAAVLAGATSATAFAQTWVSRVNGNFSDPANWLGGVVPANPPAVDLTFTNTGHGSYRAFNDLGSLLVNSFTLDTRTGTATFISTSTGSPFVMADGSEIRSVNTGQFRFGGVTGTANDMRLAGLLTLRGTSTGIVTLAGPIVNHTLSTGRLEVRGNPLSDFAEDFRLEAANTFTGGVTLVSGNLGISNQQGLGTGTFTVRGGTFRATGVVPNPVVLEADLQLRTSGNFTFSAPLSGNFGLELSSIGSTGQATANTVTLTADNPFTGTLRTANRWVMQNGFTGPAISAGTVTLSGNGRVASAGAYDLRDGGQLSVDNTNLHLSGRLNPGARLELTSSRFSLIGRAQTGAAVSESVASVVLNGQGVLFFNGRTGGVTLTTPSLVRGEFATANLTLPAASTFTVTGTPPTLVGGIVPWMAGASALITSARDLVTHDNGTFRLLTSAEYTSDITAGASANVKLASVVPNNASVTVNALVVPLNTALTGTGTVTVTSGAVVFASSSSTPFSNNLDFGAATGILHVGDIPVFNGTITGSGGLIKTGDFSFTTSQPLLYSGPTVINGGGFRFTDPDTFPNTTRFINQTAGGGELVPSLDFRGTGTAVISVPAEARAGAFRLAALNPSSAPDNALVYAGVISGPGEVYLEEGRVSLTADNTYTGGTRIFQAEVQLNRDSNLGADTAPLVLAGTRGAGIVLTGDWFSNRPTRVILSTTLNTNGFNATWNAPVDGTSAVTKLGDGTLRLNAFSPNTGFWTVGSSTVFGGRLEVNADTRINFTVSNGTLAVDGSTARVTVGAAGVLAPGDITGNAGTMFANALSLLPGSTILFDLGPQSDLIRLADEVAKGSGTLPIRFDFRVDPLASLGTYTLLTAFRNGTSATNQLTAADLTFTSNLPDFDGFFSLVTLPDNTFRLDFTVTVIPEPHAAGVLLLGVLAAGRRRR
ncbi:MAG: beta strand repeat-containing protein [Tepidisphaerales bacterium]